MMKNPPHPGLTEKLDCLESLGLTVTEGARILGVSRQALNSLLNCKNEISPEMSLRLSTAFGSSPETWLRMQIDFDPVSQKKVWGNGHAVALEI